MKRTINDTYILNGFFLIAASLTLIILSYITYRGDLSTAALIISGVACFVLGIFMFTISGSEETTNEFVNLLPVQLSINICRISSDLGLKGIAHFIPSTGAVSSPIQFIPVGSFEGAPVIGDSCFSLSPPRGMNLTPSGYLLFSELQQKYDWSPVDDVNQLKIGLKEVSEDIYQFARQADITYNDGMFIIVLHNFRYIDCCNKIRSLAAPVCCRINPCPVCSMLACMVSESLKKPCTFDLMDPHNCDLTLGIRIIESPYIHPSGLGDLH
jgi:hypothetical protein